MKSIRFMHILLCAAVLGSAAFAAGRPNILFIVTDDQWRTEFNFLPEGRDDRGKPLNLLKRLRKSKQGLAEGVRDTLAICSPAHPLARRPPDCWFACHVRLCTLFGQRDDTAY